MRRSSNIRLAVMNASVGSKVREIGRGMIVLTECSWEIGLTQLIRCRGCLFLAEGKFAGRID